jgi:hypothetical protein
MDPNSPHGAYIAAAQELRNELNLMRGELHQVIAPLDTVPEALGAVATMTTTTQEDIQKNMHQVGQALLHLGESDTSLANGTVISPQHSDMTQADTDSRNAREALRDARANFNHADNLYDSAKLGVVSAKDETEQDLNKLKGYDQQIEAVITACGNAEQAASGGGFY